MNPHGYFGRVMQQLLQQRSKMEAELQRATGEGQNRCKGQQAKGNREQRAAGKEQQAQHQPAVLTTLLCKMWFQLSRCRPGWRLHLWLCKKLPVIAVLNHTTQSKSSHSSSVYRRIMIQAQKTILLTISIFDCDVSAGLLLLLLPLLRLVLADDLCLLSRLLCTLGSCFLPFCFCVQGPVVLPPFLSAHLFELRVLLLKLSCAKGIWPACALYNVIMLITMMIIII